MTADDFTTAASAEAERRFVITPDYWGHTASERVRIFREAAKWARDYLAADIREAQAKAWDRGEAMGHYNTGPRSRNPNPYRTEQNHD